MSRAPWCLAGRLFEARFDHLKKSLARIASSGCLIHLAVIAAVLGWAALCRANRIFPSPYWEIWMWLRVALEVLALASWAAAALPPSFWLHWFAASPKAFVAGAAGAFITKMLGHYTEAWLWLGLFQSSTLVAVAALLRLCGQVVITGPAKAQIGTPAFSVQVGAGCSGLQGFGVMLAFLAIYFWAFRRVLRFPQVLLLVPIGSALQYFLNCVRIAVLILLGTWNQDAAVTGFHSIAGWLFVSAVAYGVVSVSWRFRPSPKLVLKRTFVSNRTLPECTSPRSSRLSRRRCSPRFSTADSICCIRCGCLLPRLPLFLSARARRRYAMELSSFWALALGLLVFAMWVALAPRMTPLPTQLLPRASAGYRPREGPLGFSSE